VAARPATDAELIALVPEVAVVDSAIREEYLAFAEDMMDLCLFGDRFSRAHIFLTAHCLALTQSNVAPGAPATSKVIDKINASFTFALPAAFGDLGASRWGIMFAMQLERVWAPPIVGGP
jgi:hypothetical protein